VGYNSGVNKNIKPNDPVIPNFPIKLKITDTVSNVSISLRMGFEPMDMKLVCLCDI
jgi:hypothetical protein